MNEEEIQYYLDLVDARLEGSLTLKSEKELVQKIEENPNLKLAIKDHIEAKASIRMYGENQLKVKFDERLKDINLNEVKPLREPKSGSFYLIAFLFLLATIALMFGYNKIKNNNTAIKNMAILEDPSFDVHRGDQKIRMENWENMVGLFSNKKYREVLNLTNTFADKELFLKDNKGKFLLMTGVSNFRLGQFNEALFDFQQVANLNPYYDQVQWYHALTLIEMNESDAARNKLQEIVNVPSHYRFEEAKKAIRNLE